MTKHKRIIPLVMLLTMLMSLLTALPASAAQYANVTVSGTERYDLAYSALELINKERTASGVPALVMDKTLMSYARQRAYEIAVDFEHKRPDGRGCFDGFTYQRAWAENLASGQPTAQRVYSSWSGSTMHHGTYMNKTYKRTGLACVTVNGINMWVQVFDAGTPTALSRPSNKNSTCTVRLLSGYKSPSVTVLGNKPNVYPYQLFLPSAAPSFSKGTSDGSTVTLTWNKVSNASGYKIYRYNSSTSSYVLIKTTDSGAYSCTDTVPAGVTSAKYRILAFKSWAGVYGQTALSNVTTVKITVKPDRVKFTSASKSRTYVKLNWTAVKCSGYRVYQYNPSSGKYKLTATLSSSKTTYKVSKLTPDTTYKFAVRAYNKTSSGTYIYGQFSPVKTITTKA